MIVLPRAMVAAACATLLAGCNADKAKDRPPALPRPILSIEVQPEGARQVGFAGTIQPRYQTERAFRVVGRLIARPVYVGDPVKRGQALAQIDPLPLDLALRTSEANYLKAQSQLKNAAAAEERSRTLLSRDVVSQAEYDTLKQARDAAAASTTEAQANLDKAREQRGYAVLTADLEGVVTTVDTEVGQTVSPGKKVMTLARTDIREAVVDLPEGIASGIGVGTPFEIALQADPTMSTSGKAREIAPQADSQTRTRRVRIALDRFTDAYRFGATVRATLALQDTENLSLPRSALIERDGTLRVWIVDRQAKSVSTRTVTIASDDGTKVRIASGIEPGMRIVTAGVHSLVEGQAVVVDEARDQ